MKKIDYTVLLVASLVLITIVHMGDYPVALANCEGDETPVMFANVMASKGDWQLDPVSIFAPARVYTMMQNWSAAALLGVCKIPPIFTSYFFSFAQTFLLGLAMLRLSRLVSSSAELGWATAFFTIAAQSFGWDLGIYGVPGHRWSQPLAPFLVLPILLFAFADAIEGKDKRAVLLLILGSLVQGGMTICAGLIMALFWMRREFRSDLVRSFARLGSLGVVFLVSGLPAMLLVSDSGQRISNADTISALWSNPHFVPWQIWESTQNMPFFVWWVLISAVALWKYKPENPEYKRFLCAALAGCFVLIISQLLGLAWNLPPLVSLAGMRGTMLLTALSTPLVVAYAARRLERGGLCIRLAVGALLLAGAIVDNYAILWGPVLVLATSEVVGQYRAIHERASSNNDDSLNGVGIAFLAGWVVLLVLSVYCDNPFLLGYYLPGGSDLWRLALLVALSVGLASYPLSCRWRWFLSPSFCLVSALAGAAAVGVAYLVDVVGISKPGIGPQQEIMIYLGVTAFVVFTVLFVRSAVLDRPRQTGILDQCCHRDSAEAVCSSKAPDKAIGLLTASLLAIALIQAGRFGLLTIGEPYRAAYEVQRWAREHTAKGSAFIVPAGKYTWRTISERPMIPSDGYHWYVYNRSQRLKDLSDSLHSFRRENGDYRRWDDAIIMKFASHWGGDYILRRRSDKPLSFNEVFRNSEYVVYRLPAGLKSVRHSADI